MDSRQYRNMWLTKTAGKTGPTKPNLRYLRNIMAELAECEKLLTLPHEGDINTRVESSVREHINDPDTKVQQLRFDRLLDMCFQNNLTNILNVLNPFLFILTK